MSNEKPPFMFTQWFAARRNFLEGLSTLGSLNKEQMKFVNDWFEHHVFEVGSNYTETSEWLEYTKFDRKQAKAHIDYQIFTGIASAIQENGFYMQVQNPVFGGLITQTTVLVFGSPKMIGPTTRKI